MYTSNLYHVKLTKKNNGFKSTKLDVQIIA